MKGTIEVELRELEAAGCLRRETAGQEALIVQTPGGPRVWSGVCPHLGGPLLEAKVSGGRIRCPWHLYEFDAETGCAAATRSPSVRVADGAEGGPAPRLKLRELPFRIEGGALKVTGRE
jgi:nitrite reductase/ring-hydroxylating ferredoxin subunit